MKKIYKNPEIKVLKMQSMLMQSASVQMYGTNATGDAMSRDGGSFWDDDEDSDY